MNLMYFCFVLINKRISLFSNKMMKNLIFRSTKSFENFKSYLISMRESFENLDV